MPSAAVLARCTLRELSRSADRSGSPESRFGRALGRAYNGPSHPFKPTQATAIAAFTGTLRALDT